jgi:hypothetical protein
VLNQLSNANQLRSLSLEFLSLFSLSSNNVTLPPSFRYLAFPYGASGLAMDGLPPLPHCNSLPTNHVAIAHDHGDNKIDSLLRLNHNEVKIPSLKVVPFLISQQSSSATTTPTTTTTTTTTMQLRSNHFMWLSFSEETNLWSVHKALLP